MKAINGWASQISNFFQSRIAVCESIRLFNIYESNLGLNTLNMDDSLRSTFEPQGKWQYSLNLFGYASCK
jgi:hypothetical protein